MLNRNLFSTLEVEEKRNYLLRTLLPVVKNKEGWEQKLEMFLWGSSNKDLVDFYETLLSPEKLNDYIHKKWEEIKKLNFEIKNLSNDLYKAKLEMKESLTQENPDEILHQI